MKDPYRELEAHLDRPFRSRKLLVQALTHSSVKDARHPSNERLEFLGDAVLGLVITEYLFRTFPDLDEGEMTAIKSVLVSHDTLFKTARELRLKSHLALGKGIIKKRSIPDSLAANALEAFIGAVYLDRGYRAARAFILGLLEPKMARVMKKRSSVNYKSLLQNYAQRKFGTTPQYRIVREEGPDHKKVFELAAVVCDRAFPSGKGKSKKSASLKAARNALQILQDEYGKLPHSSR